MNDVTPRHAVVVACAVLALSACNRSDRDVAANDSTLSDTIAARIDTAAGDVAREFKSVTHQYTNAEILGFVNAFNDDEIEVGTLARDKASDPSVQDFAKTIVAAHKALRTAVSTTAQDLNVAPVVPEHDRDLASDHKTGMSELRDKEKGRGFDEKFLEHEVKMHKNALDAIEDAIGREENASARPLLEKARTGVKEHLDMAQALEKKFGV